MSAPSRRRLSPEQRREQLLDAALELAAGADLSALSVQEIAATAGVSEGLLYHYFDTREALLAAALQRAADRLIARLDVQSTASPLESLVAIFSAYLDHVQAEPTAWRAVLQARSGPLAEIGAAVEEHLRELTLRELGVEEPTAVLRAVIEGWAAFEREACLIWLEERTLPRTALEDVLESSFLTALQAAARHDEQARQVMVRLGIG